MFSEATHRALEALFSFALLIAFLFIVVASIGCGGEVKATTTKPTIIIEQPAPPPVEEAIATVPPPAVISTPVAKITGPPTPVAPADDGVKIGTVFEEGGFYYIKSSANTWRVRVCHKGANGSYCTWEPTNWLPPQRSVIAKSSPVQASSDCASGGVRSRAKAAGGKVIHGVKAVGRFILRR